MNRSSSLLQVWQKPSSSILFNFCAQKDYVPNFLLVQANADHAGRLYYNYSNQTNKRSKGKSNSSNRSYRCILETSNGDAIIRYLIFFAEEGKEDPTYKSLNVS
ncbi:unnamed protein product [Fraxinus pennsylvanica]|uniref:Uncharacterized protein n=1 Tax=Fraxinus pennsylvanica TaxID=56036 RepID=A0AAD1ZCQ8_9LAMI|nr:unnamed protein product [Fraxinus pennsylvanica]